MQIFIGLPFFILKKKVFPAAKYLPHFPQVLFAKARGNGTLFFLQIAEIVFIWRGAWRLAGFPKIICERVCTLSKAIWLRSSALWRLKCPLLNFLLKTMNLFKALLNKNRCGRRLSSGRI